MTAMISPGLVGMYWLLAGLAFTTAWSVTASIVKASARRAVRR